MKNAPKKKKKKGYIQNSTLILIAFATAFFPRIIDAVGAPSPINFVHFAIVPLVCAIVLATNKVKDSKQISICQSLLFALFFLLGVLITSGFFNGAGFINVFIAFMLLAEPFMLLIVIICIPMSLKSLKQFKVWILSFAVIHVLLAFVQKILLAAGILVRTDMTEADNVQGVFYLSGGGHVVGASVAMSFGLYCLVNSKTIPLWIRVSGFLAAFFHLLLADAKQVLIVWLLAWGFLILSNIKDTKVTIQYIVLMIVIGFILFWCIQNLETFRAFKTWIRPGYYGPNGIATQLKISSFRLISNYYKSPLNWLFGLGPGHTVGRLGGWMLQKYDDLLIPLGATVHPVSQEVLAEWQETWLDSSFFSPLFGWAAIWGDIGLVGLLAYLYLCSIVWHKLCIDDFGKFMMLTVMIHGFIFTQMEEPGYMLCIAVLIGLKWQDNQIKASNKLYY